MNPADKVRPIFMPDIRMDMSFGMSIDTIDRCATCHVHIDNKNFTREKVYSYLEEELASAEIRGYKYLPVSSSKPKDLVPKPGHPIPSPPQPPPMPELCHY